MSSLISDKETKPKTEDQELGSPKKLYNSFARHQTPPPSKRMRLDGSNHQFPSETVKDLNFENDPNKLKLKNLKF